MRANAAAEARDVALIDYSYAPGVPTIDAEFDKAGKPTRVLPLERLVVEDIPQAPPIGTLRPICPVPRVPRPRGVYYWVVLQGARVGIFEGSVYVPHVFILQLDLTSAPGRRSPDSCRPRTRLPAPV